MISLGTTRTRDCSNDRSAASDVESGLADSPATKRPRSALEPEAYVVGWSAVGHGITNGSTGVSSQGLTLTTR